MIEWIANYWEEAIVAWSRRCQRIYLEGLREMSNLKEDSRNFGRNSNWAPLEYKLESCRFASLLYMEGSGRWELTIHAENVVSREMQLQEIGICSKFQGGGEE
jgi:hypothetical protein